MEAEVHVRAAQRINITPLWPVSGSSKPPRTCLLIRALQGPGGASCCVRRGYTSSEVEASVALALARGVWDATCLCSCSLVGSSDVPSRSGWDEAGLACVSWDQKADVTPDTRPTTRPRPDRLSHGISMKSLPSHSLESRRRLGHARVQLRGDGPGSPDRLVQAGPAAVTPPQTFPISGSGSATQTPPPTRLASVVLPWEQWGWGSQREELVSRDELMVPVSSAGLGPGDAGTPEPSS